MNLFKKIKLYLTQNTSTKQTIIKNSFWLMAAEGINKGSMFLITILIARKLGPEQFGVMNFVTSFVGMFIILADFGLTTLMVREVSKNQSNLPKYLVNFTFLKVTLGIITFSVVWCASHLTNKSDVFINLMLVYCGYSILSNLGDFIRAFFRPSESMQHEALLKIINGVTILIVVGFTVVKYETIYSVFWGYMVASLINLLISIAYVIKRFVIVKEKLDKIILKNALKEGFLLGLGSIFVSVYINIDQIMLGFYNYNYDLGIYSFAYKFTLMYTTIWLMIFSSILPNISQNPNQEKYKEGFKKISLLNLGLFSAAELIVLFVYKLHILGSFGLENYDKSLLVLMVLLIYCYIEPFAHRGYINLVSIGKGNITTIILLITALFNFVGNIILIPKISYHGAIITTIGSYILLVLLSHRSVKKYLH